MTPEKPDWYDQLAPEPFGRPMFTDGIAREVKAKAVKRHANGFGGRRDWRYAAAGTALVLVILAVLLRSPEIVSTLPGKAGLAATGQGSEKTVLTGSVGERTGAEAVEYVRSRLQDIGTVQQLVGLVGNRYRIVALVTVPERSDLTNKDGALVKGLPDLQTDGTYRYDFGISGEYAPQDPNAEVWYDREGILSGTVAGSILVNVRVNSVELVSLAYANSGEPSVAVEDLMSMLAQSDPTKKDTSAPSSDPAAQPSPGAASDSDSDHPDAWEWKQGLRVAARDFPDELKGIRMMDEKTGWAFGMALWSTEDGGEHWTKRSPQELLFEPLNPEAYSLLDSNSAWYVTRNPLYESRMPTLVVHRTTDGGKEWSHADLPLTQDWERKANPCIVFLDENHGWVLLTSDEKGFSVKKSLFLTTDGGRTWTRSGEGTSQADSLAIVSGKPNGLVFRTPLEGYVTAVGSDMPLIYKTQDGGRSWMRYAFPGSEEFGAVTPPRFFGEDRKQGVLALCQYNRTIFYHTGDGGATWNAVPSNIRLSASKPERVTFVDERNGFMLEGDEVNSLYRTSDGGRTWVNTYTAITGDSPSLHFISPEMGWLSSETSLLGTTHGGWAWKTYWKH